jgi:hypothetical protein
MGIGKKANHLTIILDIVKTIAKAQKVNKLKTRCGVRILKEEF